jgi:hypothetical protein
MGLAAGDAMTARRIAGAMRYRLCIALTSFPGRSFLASIVPGLTEALGVNLRDISEITGLLALHGTRFVQATEPLSNTDLYQLQRLSRKRLKLWWDTIAALSARGNAARRNAALEPLAQEILVAEMLSRVAAAWLTACGAARNRPEVERFTRPIVMDQLQAKHAVLRAWIDGGPPLGASLRLNRLRRVTERWSDFLLGHSAVGEVADEFAVDPGRMAEFHDTAPVGDRDVCTHLALLSLRHSVPDVDIAESARAETHRKMLKLLIALLPGAAFHWDGRMKGEFARRVTGGYLLNDLCATQRLFGSVEPQSPQPVRRDQLTRRGPDRFTL